MLRLHNFGKHVCKYVNKIDLFGAMLLKQVLSLIQFYFQRYECDHSMLDFHLYKRLEILLKIHAQ